MTNALKKALYFIISISLITLLISCWSPEETEENSAPTWSSSTYVDSVSTGDTLEIDLYEFVTDNAADSLLFSFVGNSFVATIKEGLLTVIAPVDTNLTYNLVVLVTDGEFSNTATFSIKVYGEVIKNSAPKWDDSLYSFDIIVGNEFIIDLSTMVSDSDSIDILSYTILGLPSGIDEIKNSNFHITADSLTDSIYTALIQVSDGSLGDTAKLVFSVSKMNSSPKWADTAFSYSVTKGDTLNINLAQISSDADLSDNLTFKILGTASGIDVINDSIYTAIPDSATPSIYTILIEVSDGKDSDTTKFTLEVSNANIIPVFTSDKPSALYEIEEGDSVIFSVEATDLDSLDTVVVGVDTLGLLPNSGSVSFTNGTFKWQSNTGDEGSYVITFYATDGKDTVKTTATINVGDVNTVPTITAASPYEDGFAEIDEEDTLTVNLTFKDLDLEDSLVILETLPAISGLTFNKINDTSAVISFIPSYSTVIDTSEILISGISVKVSDSDTNAIYNLNVKVNNKNRSPKFITNSPAEFYTKTVGDTLKIPFAASDKDTEDVVVIIVDTTTFKDDANIKIVENEIVWITGIGDIGADTISLSATDGEDTVSINVAVNINEDNTEPTISVSAASDTIVITETDSTGFIVSATPAVNGDVVTLQCVSTMPTFAKFNTTTGEFTFKANQDIASLDDSLKIYAFKFTAKGSGTQAAVAEYTQYVIVSNINRAPVFENVPTSVDKMIHVNYSDDLTFKDDDGDDITLTITSVPELPENTISYNSVSKSFSGLIDREFFTAGDTFAIVASITDGKDTIETNWTLKVLTREWDLQSKKSELMGIAAKDQNTVFIFTESSSDTAKFFQSSTGGLSWDADPFYKTFLDSSYEEYLSGTGQTKCNYISEDLFDIKYANDSLYFGYAKKSKIGGSLAQPSSSYKKFCSVAITSGSDTNVIYDGSSNLVLKSYIGNKTYIACSFGYTSPSTSTVFDQDSSIENSATGAVNSINGYTSSSSECIWVSYNDNGIVRKLGSTWATVFTPITPITIIEPTLFESNVVYFIDQNKDLHKTVNGTSSGLIDVNQLLSINNVVSVKMVNENIGWILDINGHVYFTNDGFATKTKETIEDTGASVKIISLIRATEDGHLFAQGENGEIFRY